jgi:hypothetical protein
VYSELQVGHLGVVDMWFPLWCGWYFVCGHLRPVLPLVGAFGKTLPQWPNPKILHDHLPYAGHASQIELDIASGR